MKLVTLKIISEITKTHTQLVSTWFTHFAITKKNASNSGNSVQRIFFLSTYFAGWENRASCKKCCCCQPATASLSCRV